MHIYFTCVDNMPGLKTHLEFDLGQQTNQAPVKPARTSRFFTDRAYIDHNHKWPMPVLNLWYLKRQKESGIYSISNGFNEWRSSYYVPKFLSTSLLDWVTKGGTPYLNHYRIFQNLTGSLKSNPWIVKKSRFIKTKTTFEKELKKILIF